MSSKQQNSSFFIKDQIDQKNKDFRDLLLLTRYIGSSKKTLLLGLSLLLVNSLLVMGSSRLMGYFVSDAIIAKSFSLGWKLALLILMIEALAMMSYWRGRVSLAKGATKAIFQMRQKVFHHLAKLPMKFLDRQPQGRIVTRMTHDIEGMEQFFAQGLGRISDAVLMFSIALLAMLISSPQLGFVICLAAIPGMALTFFSQKMVRELNRKLSREGSASNAKLSEFINGIPVIYGLGVEKWSEKEYSKQIDDLQEAVMKANSFYTWNRPLITFTCYLPMMVLLFYGPVLYQAGELSIGILVAFIRYCERFISPLISLAREFHQIQLAFTSAERVVQFLKREEENDCLKQGAFVPEKVKGEILFDQVVMSYDQKRDVLQGISFSVRPGEKIGLVGRTGCGKTTTVSLLTRLYEYQQGSIEVDGTDVRHWKREALRKHIGFVTQDVVLFKGTILENLVGQQDFSENYIKEVCYNTGLTRALSQSGHSLAYKLNDGATNLSSGQKQLISLTKVVLQDPSIIVLDEATANIDPSFEEIIHRCVFDKMKDKTCLLIAHRLDTLKECDRLLVFDQGRLMEQGNHNELMHRKGHFYKLRSSSLQI